MSGGEVHGAFPFSAEFSGGDRHAGAAEGVVLEELLDRVGFAAASEAGDVDEVDLARSGDVHLVVKAEELLSGGVGVLGVDVVKDAIEAVFEVRDQIFGPAEVGGVGVNAFEGEERSLAAEGGGKVGEVGGSGPIELGGGGVGGELEVPRSMSGFGGVVNGEGGWGVGDPDVEDTIGGFEGGFEVVDGGEDGEVVGVKAEALDGIWVEEGVGEVGG